jgi:hypothetical protein
LPLQRVEVHERGNVWLDEVLARLDLVRSLAFPLSALPALALAGWWSSHGDEFVAQRFGLARAELQALIVAWIAFLVSLGIWLGWTEFIPGWVYPNDFHLAWGIQSSVFALNLLSAIVLLARRYPPLRFCRCWSCSSKLPQPSTGCSGYFHRSTAVPPDA